jgi:4-hydroxybenzoate polyprenyltransferase
MKALWLSTCLLLFTAVTGLWKLAVTAHGLALKLPILLVLPAGLVVYAIALFGKPATGEPEKRQRLTLYIRILGMVAAIAWIAVSVLA